MAPRRLGAACLAGALALAGCATPLELGERRYREGDRLGALEVWRSVPSDATYYPRVRQRIDAVEREFSQLVERYKKRALYLESQGRLAESMLNYRLALQLEPADAATLDHVQHLARQLDARKRDARAALRDHLEAGRLPAARADLTALRALDPFDPELETLSRQLDDALQEEVDGLLARGRRGFTSGDYAGAREAFEEVLALDGRNESARGYLAYIDEVRAEDRAQRPPAQTGGPPQVTLRARPGGPEAAPPPASGPSDAQIRAEGHHQNALSADRAGDPYEAIREELRAQKLDPDNPRSREHLATLRGRLAGEVPGLLEQGRSHYQREELESALDAWRRALLIDPGNEEARSYVDRARTLLQNLERLRSEPPGAPPVGTN
ncbi:MAG TPA: hypothetical protein VHQ66_01035 [Myxococcota bacterium]|nr:hypothetical protein [Myxococcota bacterium]